MREWGFPLGAMEGVDQLVHERSTAQFDVDAMKVVWAGSKHTLDVADRMARLVASDPVFRKDNRTMLARKELFKNTVRKAAHAWKRIHELRLTEEEASMLRLFVDEPGYVDLHWGMFVPVIKGQGTDEQQKKWLTLAYKMEIIGYYAQTELVHGSNVQGLETTAKVSAHAVVFARLITDGKDHGVHGFIVQLRNLDDHIPLPGITPLVILEQNLDMVHTTQWIMVFYDLIMCAYQELVSSLFGFRFGSEKDWERTFGREMRAPFYKN